MAERCLAQCRLERPRQPTHGAEDASLAVGERERGVAGRAKEIGHVEMRNEQVLSREDHGTDRGVSVDLADQSTQLDARLCIEEVPRRVGERDYQHPSLLFCQ
jgi:hypothetical protein